jgi:hypothetical protein
VRRLACTPGSAMHNAPNIALPLSEICFNVRTTEKFQVTLRFFFNRHHNTLHVITLIYIVIEGFRRDRNFA